VCGLLCDWTFLKLQLKVYSCSLQKYAVQLVEPAYSPFAELKFKYCVAAETVDSDCFGFGGFGVAGSGAGIVSGFEFVSDIV
jgi:hypothetical protein